MSNVSMNIREGEPIILRLNLVDLDSTKFIRAVLKDELGNTLIGSPFTLLNQGDGKYGLNAGSLVFPVNVLEVSATYEIYDNAGFTSKSVEYEQNVQDVWHKFIDSALDIDDKFELLTDAVNELAVKLVSLTQDVTIEIEEDEDLVEIEIE